LSLHPGQFTEENTQIIPAVFTIELLSDSSNLEVVTSSILSNYNSHGFEEISDTVEPPELAVITPNGKCTIKIFYICASLAT